MVFSFAQSVKNINHKKIKNAGIKSIVLDVDGTLAHLFHKKMTEFPGIDPKIIK